MFNFFWKIDLESFLLYMQFLGGKLIAYVRRCSGSQVDWTLVLTYLPIERKKLVSQLLIVVIGCSFCRSILCRRKNGGGM